MPRANCRQAAAWITALFPPLCLSVLLGGSVEAFAQPTTTAAAAPQDPREVTDVVAGRQSIDGQLVGIEGKIEFMDHPLGRHGLAKDEAYVIRKHSGERVRVLLQEDTIVERQVSVGDRVLAFLDEDGNAISIRVVP